MRGNNTNALGTEPVGRLLIKLSAPAIAAQLINLLYNLVDRIYIGHIEGVGKLALTGVGVCLPIIMLISAFAALAGMGAAPRASIFLGRGETDKAEKVLGNSATLLVIIAAALTVIFQIFARDMLLFFGASMNTIGYAVEYIRVYTAGTVFVLLTLGLNAFISAQGFSGVSMATVLIGAVLNIILDPIFIFVLGLGVQGAAWATIISQAVSMVWILKFLSGKKTSLKIRAKNLRLEKEILLPSVALGLAPFIMQSTESLLSICFNSSLLKYGGDLAVGAMTVLTSIMQLAMMPLQGLTQGAQPIVSYNYGARNPQRVREAFRCLLMACVTYSLTMWTLAQLMPQVFAGIFTPDPELQAYAAWALRIYMAATGIFGVQIACQQTFIALGNAKASLFLAVLRKIILLIPLIYILPNFFADKVFAVFLAEPAADLIAMTTTAVLFSRQFKRAMAELEE